jgi:hypothetical protein
MDEFKKYLVENQEQFNADEPSSLIWEQSARALKTQSGENFAQVHDESISVKLDSHCESFFNA